MTITKFYESVLGANLTNSRWSWGAYDPKRDRVFLRIWSDQVESVNGEDRVLVLGNVWRESSLGHHERLRHLDMMRSGTLVYGVLCDPVATSDDVSREIKRYDETTLLKLGVLEDGELGLYARVDQRVPVTQLRTQKTAFSALVPELRAIASKKVDKTSKEVMTNARVGQGRFRQDVLALWQNKCCVTGTAITDAIRASHIKPWKDSTDDEKLDPYNGLPLVATLDALFDAGLVTFADDGNMLVASELGQEDRRALGLDNHRLTATCASETLNYLAVHRETIFRG